MRDIGYDEPLPLKVRKAHAAWLRDKASWTIWATVTFALPVGRERVFTEFRWALRLVARQYGDVHFWAAAAVEPHHDIDSFHVHALLELGSGADADIEALQIAIQQTIPLAGRLWLRRYDPSKGASEYITKTVAPELWLVCPRVGRCARRRCAVEQGGQS